VGRISTRFSRLLREPPFRLLAKFAAKRLSSSLSEQVFWQAVDRPQYAAGILFAAEQAKQLEISHISVIEFGVAGGAGLLIMQQHAETAAREFGVAISVFGFDLGIGLPQAQDFRDHPDLWRAGDYPMDATKLRAQLHRNTLLVLGDVAQTVPDFVEHQTCPVGFVSVDLDLYSSTQNALHLFSLPKRQMLPHTPVYFDDVLLPVNHRFAGELLAIRDFNTENENVKIDNWRGLKGRSAFPESPWLDAMYMAHDLTTAPTRRSHVAVL
jgi:hypothetical protein